MHLHFRNVNDAFKGIVQNIHKGTVPTIKTGSRNGPVIQIEEPVLITYSHPKECVLFNSARDCNPFFHVYEILWMLAGRNDVASLAYYAKQMGSYSDDGITLNAAYGYRWRHAETLSIQPDDRSVVDQLKLIVAHLKANPGSRRAVLQMWTVEDDLLKIGPDNVAKDTCCNTAVYFAIRKANKSEGQIAEQGESPAYLDMTVTNRSNDLIWGCLGSDHVHFTFLQEYMAACIGVEVGVYNHFTNNLHVYTENNSGWKPMEWLNPSVDGARGYSDFFEMPEQCKHVPLVKDPETFDREVLKFVELNKNSELGNVMWSEPFLAKVAQPMCHAFHMHKQRDYNSAMFWVGNIEADDWRIAAKMWIEKRKFNWENKSEQTKEE